MTASYHFRIDSPEPGSEPNYTLVVEDDAASVEVQVDRMALSRLLADLLGQDWRRRMNMPFKENVAEHIFEKHFLTVTNIAMVGKQMVDSIGTGDPQSAQHHAQYIIREMINLLEDRTWDYQVTLKPASI